MLFCSVFQATQPLDHKGYGKKKWASRTTDLIRLKMSKDSWRGGWSVDRTQSERRLTAHCCCELKERKRKRIGGHSQPDYQVHHVHHTTGQSRSAAPCLELWRILSPACAVIVTATQGRQQLGFFASSLWKDIKTAVEVGQTYISSQADIISHLEMLTLVTYHSCKFNVWMIIKT